MTSIYPSSARTLDRSVANVRHAVAFSPEIIFIVSIVYTSVTAIATAMVLLYRFYCIFVFHVLVILDLYFASWAAVRA